MTMTKSTRGRFRSERGQAAVETAIVMPIMVFFILGIIQLTVVQQARLMLEYAVFAAARTGSVWNGDQARMEQAAIIALLPTRPTSPMMPETNGVSPWRSPGSQANVFATLTAFERVRLANLGYKVIDLQVLSPKASDFTGPGASPDGLELDFDYVDNNSLATITGAADSNPRRKTQLTVRLRYLYEMRIPFANWVIWESWWATRAGRRLLAKFDPGQVISSDERRFEYFPSTANQPYDGLGLGDFLWMRLMSKRNRFYLPLVATYTIRMQSNFFRQNAARN